MTNKIDVFLDQAYAAYNQGHLEKAEALCRDVLAVEPTQGDALLLLGLIAYRSGALEPAAELLYQAVKLYPDIESYRLTLASVLQRQGRLAEALTMYQQVPGNPQGLAQQGFIFLDLGRTDDARKAFRQAVNLTPDLPETTISAVSQAVTASTTPASKSNKPGASSRLILVLPQVNGATAMLREALRLISSGS